MKDNGKSFGSRKASKGDGGNKMPWKEEVFFIAVFLFFVALVGLGIAASNGWLGSAF